MIYTLHVLQASQSGRTAVFWTACPPLALAPRLLLCARAWYLLKQIPMAVVIQPMALVGPNEEPVNLVDFGERFRCFSLLQMLYFVLIYKLLSKWFYLQLQRLVYTILL